MLSQIVKNVVISATFSNILKCGVAELVLLPNPVCGKTVLYREHKKRNYLIFYENVIDICICMDKKKSYKYRHDNSQQLEKGRKKSHMGFGNCAGVIAKHVIYLIPLLTVHNNQ